MILERLAGLVFLIGFILFWVRARKLDGELKKIKRAQTVGKISVIEEKAKAFGSRDLDELIMLSRKRYRSRGRSSDS